MRPVVIVVVLPLPQLLVEQVNVVGDAVLVEELVELLVVDPVRALDLAVQVRRAGTEVLHRARTPSRRPLCCEWAVLSLRLQRGAMQVGRQIGTLQRTKL